MLAAVAIVLLCMLVFLPSPVSAAEPIPGNGIVEIEVTPTSMMTRIMAVLSPYMPQVLTAGAIAAIAISGLATAIWLALLRRIPKPLRPIARLLKLIRCRN